MYDSSDSIKDKIKAVATKIYGAADVKYDAAAAKAIAEIEALDPKSSTFPVREVKLSAGAEFIVVLTGAIMTMPGLPKKPAAINIDVDNDGNITGLF